MPPTNLQFHEDKPDLALNTLHFHEDFSSEQNASIFAMENIHQRPITWNENQEEEAKNHPFEVGNDFENIANLCPRIIYI